MAYEHLQCPGCGAALSARQANEPLVTCEFCGSQLRLGPKINAAVADLVVQREIEELLGQARLFADQSLFDRAIQLYDRVLELDPDNQAAWLGKAGCAEDGTSLKAFHLSEAYQCFQRAIETAPDEEARRWVRQRLLQRMPDRIRQHQQQLHTYFAQFANARPSLDEALHDYQIQLRAMLSILARLQTQFPDAASIPGTIVQVARRALGGLRYDPDDTGRVYALPEAQRAEVAEAEQSATAWLAARNPQESDAEPVRRRTGSAAGFTPGWWLALILFGMGLAGAAVWALLAN